MPYVRQDGTLNLPPRWWRWIAHLARPICGFCRGEGGWMTGYYEPEFSECPCCNRDGCNDDKVTHVWRWSWWLFRFREWRTDRRLQRMMDADERRWADLRYDAGLPEWRDF